MLIRHRECHGNQEKEKAPAPSHFTHQWQNVAIRHDGSSHARSLYRQANPQATLIEAYRTVAEFIRDYNLRYRS